MEFSFSEDQAVLMGALEQVIGSHRTPPHCTEAYVYDSELERRLMDSGFLSVASNGYTDLESALVALRLSSLAVCVEAASSLLLGPILPDGFESPVGLAESPDRGAIRFLPMARTVVFEDGGTVKAVTVADADVEPCSSSFAFPYGFLPSEVLASAEALPVEAVEFVRRCRLSIAAELAGAFQGALDATVAYTKDRQQFGRPLGSFQAIQHRLAMAAQVVESCRYLVLYAANSGTQLDASMAIAYAQSHAPYLTFDFHQFSGAMGLTLEYPLHLWTYRIRALQGALGGAAAQAASLADSQWRGSKA